MATAGAAARWADPARLRRRRAVVERGMTAVMLLAAVAAVVPLLLILFYVLKEGLGAINLDLLTQDPNRPGRPGGGVHNSIVGSAIMVSIAMAIGVPIAIGCGVFLAEYGQNRAGTVMRFLVDVVAGIPSITVGLFVYGIFVLPRGHFSGLAGAIALAIILIPVVARITEEMVLLVPRSLREASFALGAARWVTVVRVVLPTALPGIITGVVLALSRIAGEAAPLLFTSLGNQFFTTDTTKPMDALPQRIFVYATGPYDYWHEQAWAIALLLVLFILAVSMAVRVFVGNRIRVH